MVDAMTVEELHAKLAEYIAAGHGNARVFASMRGDHDLDAAMQASNANWTPAEFELTSAEITGRDAPMLTIGHVAFGYPEDSDEEEAWHEFHDGPWAGQRVEVGVSPDGYEHLIVHRPTMPGVGEWVPENAWPDLDRYVRTGSYGETTVMTWRQA